jgi:hypothetical protein
MEWLKIERDKDGFTTDAAWEMVSKLHFPVLEHLSAKLHPDTVEGCLYDVAFSFEKDENDVEAVMEFPEFNNDN